MDIKTGGTSGAVARILGAGTKAGTLDKPANHSGAAASAKVSLSATSQMGMTENDADVRMEKVLALREALANGTLVINPQRIADGLLDSARALLD